MDIRKYSYLSTMRKYSQAYLTAMELYEQVCEKGMLRRVTIEQYSEMGYAKMDTGFQEKYVPEEITVVDTKLFSSNFTPRATKVLLKIVCELHMNNALWFFEPKSTDDYRSLKELRDKGILYKTENPHIHLVSPNAIRRGSKAGVAACTAKELRGVSRVEKDNVRPLGYRNSINMLKAPDKQTDTD